jgi:molybdate transport system substrate-binding protein
VKRSLRVVLAALAIAAMPAYAVTTVAAASDLQFALPELVAAFKQAGGGDVRLVMGSSGNLARQIEVGAPFELFMSADEALVERLAAAGRTEDRGALYAVGQLVLAVPKQSKLALDPQLSGLARALNDGTVRRIAIANPDHAPYGRAAREALQSVGAWPLAPARIVLGESVTQAAQFLSTGAVDAALIAVTLIQAPGFAERTRYVVVANALHQPLRQRMVLVKGAKPPARELYRFLQSERAKAIFARSGLTP